MSSLEQPAGRLTDDLVCSLRTRERDDAHLGVLDQPGPDVSPTRQEREVRAGARRTGAVPAARLLRRHSLRRGGRDPASPVLAGRDPGRGAGTNLWHGCEVGVRARPQQRQERPHHPHRAEGLGRVDPLEVVRGHLGRWGGRRDPGVVRAARRGGRSPPRRPSNRTGRPPIAVATARAGSRSRVTEPSGPAPATLGRRPSIESDNA